MADPGGIGIPGAGPGPDSRRLDEPPEQPAGTARRADRSSLVQNQMRSQKSTGLGVEGSNPQVLVIQNLGEILARFQRLGSLLPALAPAFMQISQSLQQAIPQAMADQLAGTDQTGAAVPPPSGAPMPPPPSAPPPMAAPPPMPGGAPSMVGAPVVGPTPAGVM